MRRLDLCTAHAARRAAMPRGPVVSVVQRFRRGLALVGLAALTACSGPNNRGLDDRHIVSAARERTRPAVDLRLAGEGSIVSGATPNDPAEITPDSPSIWNLERCVRQALVANRSLLDADDQVASQSYSLIAAEAEFQVRLRPGVFATANDEGDETAGADLGVQKLFRNGTLIEVVPSVRKTDGAYESGYSASITQPLLRGRQREFVEASVDRARFANRSAARAAYLLQVDVVLNTIVAAYRVVQERESMRLIAESAARAEGHLTAARARERAGLSTSLDVFRASQLRNRARDASDTATRAFQDATDALRVLLALPLNTVLEVEAPLDVAPDGLPMNQAIAVALARRVELFQAEDDITEARRLARVAEINTQLDLDLVLTMAHFGDSDAIGDSFDLGSPRLGISLASNTDIRRIAEKAAYEQAKLRADVTSRSYLLRRDLVIQGVKRSLRGVERGKRSINLQREQIHQAEGKLIVARKKFELGIATNFNVIEAEDDLRSAETALIRSVAATISSQYALRADIGTLVELPDGVR